MEVEKLLIHHFGVEACSDDFPFLQNYFILKKVLIKIFNVNGQKFIPRAKRSAKKTLKIY